MKHASVAHGLNADALRLRTAAEAGDWDVVAREAAALRVLAGMLQARSDWTPVEREALEELMAAMRTVLGAIAGEQQQMAGQLAHFHRHREAWMAYLAYDHQREVWS